MPYDADLEAAREDEVKSKLIEAMEAAAAKPDVSQPRSNPASRHHMVARRIYRG